MEQEKSGLTHVDESGAAHMVNVVAKEVTLREAEASGAVTMSAETLARIRENALVKGDVLAVARVAGILAAKRTSELIPLCHGLPVGGIELEFELVDFPPAVHISARVSTAAQTGVEMEALVAVSVAALTVYDMCKAVDRAMRVSDVRVTFKSGGRSGTYQSD